jgi:hypothetical protein
MYVPYGVRLLDAVAKEEIIEDALKAGCELRSLALPEVLSGAVHILLESLMRLAPEL